ncbi:MAG: hypothetical protein HYS59_02305 [Candidatus Vogelbacteria bacterium]|nr:hypothetical protein [Candidatus Vogelbacteria bacterium]
MKLKEKGVALGAATLAGLFALILHLIAVNTGAGADYIELVLPYHPGATLSTAGAFIHAFWMFIYGYASGWVFARVYNSA